ncbi:APC family permease [Clostridium sp. AWRP]|uniref:APC family permease n=1 Tax=Clostridium sp. AWRP TaxID=2212991 RepID=UPI000FD7D154|nr:APC family permease [Clostridium sp. AWRP]AZV58397.1 amino acid permease [Clostridium sp. AWRP]
MNNTKKFGFWSIVLLGINGVIGSGIFLLPGKAYAVMGSKSIGAYVIDMILVLSMSLCFAEAAGLFDKAGGPYIYAKEAFGNFAGFEVGVMKWIVSIVAWATMAVAFPTALGAIWPQVAHGMMKNIIAISIILGLGIINILGIEIVKYLNNIATIAKLLPLILFIAIGIFFIKGGNYISTVPINSSALGSTLIVVFYAFTGFETIAVAAEDMDNPKKNLPIAIIITMVLASTIYVLIQVVSIGILGTQLAQSSTPVADAAKVFLGPLGKILVTIGTIISILGINISCSFNTPRSAVALSEGGVLPKVIRKKSRFGTPYVAIIITVCVAIPLVLTGSFIQLAAISVVSRFTQYIPTCLAIIMLRKKRPNEKSTFRVPFGPVLPILAVAASIWILTKATPKQLIWGLGALVICAPIYFIMKHYKVNNLSKNVNA